MFGKRKLRFTEEQLNFARHVGYLNGQKDAEAMLSDVWKHDLIGSKKSISDVKSWLKTHGIDRGTASQIYGFLWAYGIDMSDGVDLCAYGLTYSFAEFREWFYKDIDEAPLSVGEVVVVWNDNLYDHAVINIMAENSEEFGFKAKNGLYYNRCTRFTTMSEFREILNTPKGQDPCISTKIFEFVLPDPEPEEDDAVEVDFEQDAPQVVKDALEKHFGEGTIEMVEVTNEVKTKSRRKKQKPS